MVLSVTALSGGVAFAVLLAVASAWSSSLDRQRKARLVAEGCPNEQEKETKVVGLVPLGPRRWRVMAVLEDDLRPLLVSPDFRVADREHRRVLLALANREFALLASVKQQPALDIIAGTIPEPPSGGSFRAQLEVAHADDLPMHKWKWRPLYPYSLEERVIYSPYPLSRDQVKSFALRRLALPGAFERRNEEKPVQVPQHISISTYVVSTERDLTEIEIVRAAQGTDLASPLATQSPKPGIEVLDCGQMYLNLWEAEKASFPNRLVEWWFKQPLGLFSMVSLMVLFGSGTPDWLLVAAMTISPLLAALVAAAVPWGVFYLLRWIVRGFAGSSE